MLADISYTDEYREELEDIYKKPTFGGEVIALEGEEVSIMGFFLPLDLEGDYYMLSQNPYATCFFCGGGGPESVIQIKFAKKPRGLSMDDLILIKGQLTLNDNDPLEMYYLLTNAEVEY